MSSWIPCDYLDDKKKSDIAELFFVLIAFSMPWILIALAIGFASLMGAM